MSAISMYPRGGLLEQRDEIARILRSSACVDIPGGRMSSLDQVVPQATQLPLLNLMVEMVVLGECDPLWLQRKIGFKSLRNVYYYIEAARWARLVEEDDVRPTSLGRRYVNSRFDPRVVIEGLRGRALFEEVMRVTGGAVPTPEVVASVLRRWSFRYSKGTLTRRARDFCTLFGRIIDDATNPAERKLVIRCGWVSPKDVITIYGVATVWPALQLTPKNLRGSKRTASDDDASQLRLPKVDA